MQGARLGTRKRALTKTRPLNLPGQFTVRATHFHSEIGLFHSDICVLLSHDTRFRSTKDSLVIKMNQLGMD